MSTGDFLKATTFCRDMNEEEVVALAGVMVERTVDAQAIVFSQNEPGTALFVVREGGVKVIRRATDGSEKILGLMRPGDIFGELAFLDLTPRSATAKTVQATVLLELDQTAYAKLVAGNPGLAAKVMGMAAKLLAGRLRGANERIINAVQWGSGGTASAGAASDTGEGDAGGGTDGGFLTIQRLIDEGMEVKVVFPEGGEMLGKLRQFRLNEMNLPELSLMDSTQHLFIIPYHAVKYIFPMEKKKSTSKFL